MPDDALCELRCQLDELRGVQRQISALKNRAWSLRWDISSSLLRANHRPPASVMVDPKTVAAIYEESGSDRPAVKFEEVL